MRPSAPKPCPECGSTKVLPITYGLPGSAMLEAAERGEIILGGCLVDDANPLWACASCVAQFGRLDGTGSS